MISWRRKWQSSLVFLLEKPHRQGSLEGYRPRGCKQLDVIEHASTPPVNAYSVIGTGTKILHLLVHFSKQLMKKQAQRG